MLRFSAFRCAFSGIAFMLRTQPHTRCHLVASIAVVILGIVLNVTRLEWLALIFAMAIVWTAEAFNTAIEVACDAITLEKHPLIGRAKDVSAGAVLIAAIFAAAVGTWVFLPRIWAVI